MEAVFSCSRNRVRRSVDESIGVLSHSEVVRLVDDQQDVATTTLAECPLSPVVTLGESEDIATAATIINQNGLRYLLVTKANKIIGYLTDCEITKVLSESEKNDSSKQLLAFDPVFIVNAYQLRL